MSHGIEKNSTGNENEEPAASIHCGVCIKRGRHVTACESCSDCVLKLCDGCGFVHRNIPACLEHVVSPLAPKSTEKTETDEPAADNERGAKAEVTADMWPVLVPKNTFSSELVGEELKPVVRAVLVMESGVILVADWANCTLKAFDKDGLFLGDCFIPKTDLVAGRIHGITHKDENTVFLTIPTLKKIATVGICGCDAKIEFSLVLHDTRRRYFGLAHLPCKKQLVVGSTDKVDVVSYTGRLLQSLPKGRFQNPYNMASEASGVVFISDTKSNCLFRLSETLEVDVFRIDGGYAQLRGITSDGKGNVFYCALKASGVEWMTTGGKGEFMGCVMPRVSRECEEHIVKGVGIHYQQVRGERWLVVGQDDGTVKIFTVDWAE